MFRLRTVIVGDNQLGPIKAVIAGEDQMQIVATVSGLALDQITGDEIALAIAGDHR